MSRSENINVSLRFRPLSSREIDDFETNIWNISKSAVSLKQEYLHVLAEAKRIARIPKSYAYNYCFSPRDSNQAVYETVGKRVVLASLEGYNGTIFAYGQTGSGKTYTMMGSEGSEMDSADERRKMNSTPVPKTDRRSVSPFRVNQSFQRIAPIYKKPTTEKEKGIIIYALEELFLGINKNPEKTYFLSCSYLEIYNEQVYDLLTESSHFQEEPLTINEDSEKGFYVKGLSEHAVRTIEEVKRFIERGETNRRYAATAMNHHSSRSHTIFKLSVASVASDSGENEVEENSITTESVLNFVDLAGSERVNSVQAENSYSAVRKNSNDSLALEGKHINTSLFYLCQVINRLSEKTTIKSDNHIPYRNSNLTKILRSSLGGNAITCIICTATPTLNQFEMTLSTLRFGGTAKTITNNIEANIKSNKSAELIEAYQRDIEQLKKELEIAQQGGQTRFEEAIQVKTQLEERISRLTQMLINQSRQHAPHNVKKEKKSHETWLINAGDLSADRRLEIQKFSPKDTDKENTFEDRGRMAFNRMKLMHLEAAEKDKEIAELVEMKDDLVESKANLKNDLKKALTLCKDLSDKKQSYKAKCKKFKEKQKMLTQKLSLLEVQQGLDKLSSEQLQKLESFYFCALDSVKNAKFRRKYESQLSMMNQHDSGMEYSPHSDHSKFLDELGLNEEASVSKTESDPSFEFKGSFYRSRTGNDSSFASTAQDMSTMLLLNLLDNEYEDSRSPVKQRNIYGTHNLKSPLKIISESQESLVKNK
ncbi:unnamed protein product [Blepharisma stoltei]|uniref:Kinesin-like protein n=1 Tax=Blepharisma stoltei TaxID=1481888 RepID=A0AAU9JLS3_9CILI|nr:unnamed protein product [Blepharisma stoltei]